MTHIENLQLIAQAGELRSYNGMVGAMYINMANDDVQSGRAGIIVPQTGKPLHDYVPLYFGIKTPMAACNQHQNEDFIYLQFSTDLLQTPGTVISDGNARAGATNFREVASLDDFALLDVRAIHSVKYAGDPELKRRKQAEALIRDSVPFSAVYNIATFSISSRRRVLAVLDSFGIQKRVSVSPGYYFVQRTTP